MYQLVVLNWSVYFEAVSGFGEEDLLQLHHLAGGPVAKIIFTIWKSPAYLVAGLGRESQPFTLVIIP